MAGSTRQTSESARELPDLTVAFSTRGLRALGLRPERGPRPPASTTWCWRRRRTSDPRIAPHLGALARGRDDVTVVRLASSGLARSRNAALELARGDVVLLADDDVRHLPGAFDAIRRYFRDRPASSLLVGQSLDAEGAPRRRPLPPARSRFSTPAAPPATSSPCAARRCWPPGSASTRASAPAPAPRTSSARSTSSSPTACAPGFAASTGPLPVTVHRGRARRGLGRSRGRPRPRRGHRPRLPPPGAARPPRLRAEERPPLRLGARSSHLPARLTGTASARIASDGSAAASQGGAVRPPRFRLTVSSMGRFEPAQPAVGSRSGALLR